MSSIVNTGLFLDSQKHTFSSSPMIGNFCTCDVENYGDLLYPIIFKHMMLSRQFTGEIKPFGFLDGRAPAKAGYEVDSIFNLLSEHSDRLDALVVGGGDIIRTDKDVLASHYESLYRQRMQKNPLYGIRKRLFGETDLTKNFVHKFMGYRSIGPLILNARDYPAIGLVAYCSCGVPFEFKEEERSAVANAFNNASFIYVRDHQSAEKLKRAGVTQKIEVAPDLIVTLSDFYDRSAERERGRQILESYGVDTSRRVLGLQCAPQSASNYAEIVKQITQYSRQAECDVALIPIGYCHEDDKALKRLAAVSNGAFKYVGVRAVQDMVSVLAACDTFLGTSMHANITAFSFGIPHLVGPLAVDKLGGFLDITGLDPAIRLNTWSEVAARLQWVQELGTSHFEDKADIAKKAVHKTFDQLTHAISPRLHSAANERTATC